MKSGTALASSGWIKGGLQIARNKISTSINPLRQQRGLQVVSSSHVVLSHLNHFTSPSFGLCDPISWYHKNVLLKPLFVSLSFPSLLGPSAVFSLGSPAAFWLPRPLQRPRGHIDFTTIAVSSYSQPSFPQGLLLIASLVFSSYKPHLSGAPYYTKHTFCCNNLMALEHI